MTKVTNGKEMVEAFKIAENGKEIARIMDNFINPYGADVSGFIDNLKLEEDSVRNKFTLISLMWIKKLNYFKEANWFDGRNEYSVNTASKINSLLGESLNSYVDGYDGTMDNGDYEYEQTESGEKISMGMIFVEKMGRTHRTLQQSFSRVAFTWLSELENVATDETLVNMSNLINKELDYNFNKTPLI